MTSNALADCFYRRGVPKIRRNPVTIRHPKSLLLSFWAGWTAAAAASPTAAAVVQSVFLLSHAIGWMKSNQTGVLVHVHPETGGFSYRPSRSRQDK